MRRYICPRCGRVWYRAKGRYVGVRERVLCPECWGELQSVCVSKYEGRVPNRRYKLAPAIV